MLRDMASEAQFEKNTARFPREKILDMVKRIVLSEAGAYPAKVYLFGSWARGDERRSSDIDIAVDCMDDAAAELFIRLREAFEESILPYRVDVVNLAEATPELINNVRKEGVLWKG
jgi:predicted nucleotidyltransferase